MSVDFKQVLTFLTPAAGPLATVRAPAMAPDLREQAAWLSGALSVLALLWATASLSRERVVSVRLRALKQSLIVAAVCAVVYFLINVLWTRETGGWIDRVVLILIVLTYSVFFASLAFASVAFATLKKHD